MYPDTGMNVQVQMSVVSNSTVINYNQIVASLHSFIICLDQYHLSSGLMVI